MARTPDRRPGPTEEEEEIRFYENLTPPTVSGAFNFDGDNFVFYDQLGYFNPRGGGVFTVSGGFANTVYTASFSSGSYASDIGSDVFFYVSGSPGSAGSLVRGTAAFGGDLVVTGSSIFAGGLSGSLTKLSDGTSYLVAGNNIVITSASNGSVTFSASNTPGGLAGGALTGSYPNPGLANRPVLVFQPGGPSTSDNVFTTWPALMTAFSGSTGQVIIEIDTTYGSATISAGTHDLQERAILQGARTDLAFPPALSIPDGAVLKDPRIIQQLELICLGTTAPNFEITTRGIVTFRLGYITMSGTEPLIRLSGTDDMILQLDELQIVTNTPTSAIIDINSATASASIFAYRGVLFSNDNVVSGVASSLLLMYFDASVTVGSSYRFPTNPNFLGSSNSVLLDNAPLIGYDDSLVANSYGVTNVQEALDEIKRRQYFFSTTPNTIYTTSSVAIKGNESGIDSAADKGTDVFFYVSGSLGSDKSLFGGDVFSSGTISAIAGFSGSHTTLADGTSYIAAGDNVTVTSSSSGQITISSAQADSYWKSTQSGIIFTTGSVEITGSLTVKSNSTVDGTFRQGDTNLVTGLVSHAQGFLTTGSGNYSHAEGYQVQAKGESSHAEGYITIASGNYSHAEGERTLALGQSSHAEGHYTLALGDKSHTEGYLTTGSGVSSHAEGGETLSIGLYSHAEGYRTIASGTFSHAEGHESYASGSQSHAEGYHSLAIGIGSHAEGFFTTASADDSHSEGFRAITYGYASHAEGSETIAWGSKSHAEGFNTLAYGDGSHAEGNFTTASLFGSHAEGQNTHASGSSSHAEGYYSITFGFGSHAEGYITTASVDYSHAEGNQTHASGNFSHAEGGNTLTIGESSHAEGGSTTAIGFASHAEGFFTTTTGLGSHAEGAYSTAGGSISHTEGAYTLTTTDAAHAEGYLTTGSGLGSHAEGYLTVASGSYSHAGGIGTIASGSGQTVFGSYNIRNNDFSLFVVGDGSDDSNRRDVLRVNQQKVEVTGSLLSTLGFSGSLTRLADGTPYIIEGTGLNVVSSSNGPITLSIKDSVVATISGSTFSGAVKFNGGLSGSLTNLTDGSRYIVAGPNITIATSSIGQISISASLSGDGSNGNLLTANGTGGINAQPNLNFDGSTLQVNGSQTISNDLTVNGSMVSISSTNLDIKDPVIGIGFASGSIKQTAGDRGWIGGLASLDNVLFKWDNSAAEFALARTTASSTASLPIPISSYANLHTNNIQANIITASLGFSGSLTRLTDGTAYILGGTNISVVSSSNGGITISAPNLALVSSPYVTIGNDANLTSERALTAGTGLTLADAGANSTVTLSINDSVVSTLSGSTFTGAVKFNAGLSGSLTQLVDGTSYLRSGDYISIASASNGAVTISGTGIAPVGSSYVTIGNDSTLTNERALTSGTGLTLTDGGANTNVTLAIDNSVVATVSGTTFTGATRHNVGLSGSLTKLVDGTSYLIAGTGISIISQSNGAVTVTSTAVTSPAGSDTQVQFNDGGVFGASSLLTFNKAIGALTASILAAPVMSASSVVSASKTFVDTSEVNGYLKVNPYESSLIPVGTTDSTYIFSSQSLGKLYFSSYHDEDNSAQTTSLDWLKGGALRTGLLFGGKLTTAVGSTTFSITSGSGLIVDYNTSDVKDPYPIIKQVTWSNFVSQSLTFVTSSQLSYIGIDKNATIVQQTSPFTPADRANVLVIGRISHPTLTTAQLANMFPDTAYGTVEWHEDFTRAFGPLKISGHKLTTSGSSLRVNKGAGASYIAGGNYFFNTERPNYILDTEDTEKTNIVYTRLWVSGSDLKIEANPPTGFSALDPDNYNLDGNKTAVPSGSFSVLRLYWIPRNSRDVINSYYGSEVYSTLGEAVAGITTENFVESDNTKTSNIFLGYVAVQSGSTDLSDPLKAKIIQGGLSRNVAGGGGAAGTGAGSLPGGIAGYVQYNLDGTNFGGDAEFTYNATTNVLTVGNAMIGGTGELMGSSTTFDLLDTTVQTINFGGAATTIDVGSTGGTTNLFGAIKAPQGLSGSLTKLTDGSSYLISSGNISITSASNGAVTIGTTAISPTEHRTVRQLVHLAEEGGPFEGFTLGSYMEILPTGNAFPTSIIWWEDSSKVKKIVEETITYNSQKLVTTDQWKVYDTDGTTVLATATDTINYSGVFEINRTRTIT